MANIIQSIESRYTTRAKPWRGYHDSEDIVIFSGGTEEEQLVKMHEILVERRKTNMWAYTPQKLETNKWRVNYGYDSGD